MFTAKERQRYNEDRHRACDRLGITESQYNGFRREGAKLIKIWTDACNGDITQEAMENIDEPIIKKVSARARELRLFVYYQTDPRGASIYLDTKAIPENNYTQAVCIY